VDSRAGSEARQARVYSTRFPVEQLLDEIEDSLEQLDDAGRIVGMYAARPIEAAQDFVLRSKAEVAGDLGAAVQRGWVAKTYLSPMDFAGTAIYVSPFSVAPFGVVGASVEYLSPFSVAAGMVTYSSTFFFVKDYTSFPYLVLPFSSSTWPHAIRVSGTADDVREPLEESEDDESLAEIRSAVREGLREGLAPLQLLVDSLSQTMEAAIRTTEQLERRVRTRPE